MNRIETDLRRPLARPVATTRLLPATTKAEQPSPAQEAAQAVHDATFKEAGPNSKVDPQAGSAALLAQVEAHPELADEILAASRSSLEALDGALHDPGQPQEVVNAVVDNLARLSEWAGEPGLEILGRTMAPESGGETDHLTVALATTSFGERLTDVTSRYLAPGSQQKFREETALVREATVAVAGAWAPAPAGANPNAMSAARELNARVAAHPELADLLVRASQGTLGRLGSYLESGPPAAEVAGTVDALAEVFEQAGPEGQDVVLGALAKVPPGDEGLLKGLAQSSLRGQTELGQDLMQLHGEAGLPIGAIFEMGSTLQEVNALLEEGGLANVQEATELLRVFSAENPEHFSTYLLQALEGSGAIQRIAETMGPSARIGPRGMSPVAQFTDILGDLSAIASRSGDLDAISGVAAQLASHGIENDDVWDTAFRQAVERGHGADLMAAVVEELNTAGREDLANSFLDSLNNGLSHLTEEFAKATETRNGIYAELAYLQQQFGPLGSEEEQAQAAQDFLANFSEELAEFERLGAALGTDLDVIDRLRLSVPGLDVEQLDDTQHAMLLQVPVLAETQGGSRALGQALEQQAKGYSTFLDHLDALDLDDDDRAAFREKAGAALARVAVEQSAGAAAEGDSERAQQIIAGLENVTGIADLMGLEDKADLVPLLDAMQLVIEAGDEGTETALKASKAAVEKAISDLQGRGFNLEANRSLKLLTGGTALLGAATMAAGGWPDDAREWVEGIADGAGVALDVGKLIAGWKGGAALAGKLGAGSNAVGLVGTVLSTWDMLQSIGDQDFEAAALHAGAAVGGVMMMASSAAVTGVGFVLVVGAAAGLYQLNRVRFSNRHENGNTEDYIQALIPHASDDVVRHLRNADRDGVNVGIVLQAMAERLNLTPEEFFNQVGELDPDHVLELVESAHWLVSEETNTVAELPPDHPTDPFVGRLIKQIDGRYYFVDENGVPLTGEPMSHEQGELLSNHVRDEWETHYDLNSGILVVGPSSVQGFANYWEFLFEQNF